MADTGKGVLHGVVPPLAIEQTKVARAMADGASAIQPLDKAYSMGHPRQHNHCGLLLYTRQDF